ncbi:hypothetical protein [Tellurirhabdus bombi]|uniref:hypothetical protein n=1 Tax=Tellurirhabdus bombi TaxID=2907205 RepID=UPI001F41CE68|nr:hypothetical protein [Tellurirhabdus bombi]
MKSLKETLLISASIGSFLIWFLETRTTGNFTENYWLLMLCLAFLLGFQYFRYQRKHKAGDQPAVPLRDKPVPGKGKRPNKKRRK